MLASELEVEVTVLDLDGSVDGLRDKAEGFLVHQTSSSVAKTTIRS